MKKLSNFYVESKPMLVPVSFLDVMTVLLLYLVVTFSPDEAKVELTNEIQMPKSNVALSHLPDLRIQITTDKLRVNGEEVRGFNPLSAGDEEWKKYAEILKARFNPEKAHLLIMADKNLTFQTLDLAFAHATSAGYSDIYLLTEWEETK